MNFAYLTDAYPYLGCPSESAKSNTERYDHRVDSDTQRSQQASFQLLANALQGVHLETAVDSDNLTFKIENFASSFLRKGSFGSVIAYGVSSLFASLLRRIVTMKLFFDFPIFISITQVAAILIVLELTRFFKILQIQSYTLEGGREMFLPSFLHTFASYISMNAIEGASMPMFASVKCFCPIAVILFSNFISRRPIPSYSFLLLVFILCVGSSLTNIFEFMWERWSYLFGLAALTMNAASFVQLENLALNYSPLDLLYVNSFNELIFLLVADFFEDELRGAIMFFFASASVTLIVTFFFLIVFGVLTHLTLFYCIVYANSLTLSLTADVRSAIQVFIAYFFSVYVYYDIIPGISNIIGILMVLAASAALIYRNSSQQLYKTSTVFKC
uniref:TPT domain-containing protein n=1 Tax=Ascaris lumbricoides TaxID=6252 RepID=A0A0M3HQV6_ASCLU